MDKAEDIKWGLKTFQQLFDSELTDDMWNNIATVSSMKGDASTELLLQCMVQTDPMLSMLERLCEELMEAEVSTWLVQKRTSTTLSEQSTAVATVLAVWTRE